MEPYAAKGGISGVTEYELGEEYIIVRFRDNSCYLYNYDVPGKEFVEDMKVLAKTGRSLATYINIYVRDRYARRLS